MNQTPIPPSTTTTKEIQTLAIDREHCLVVACGPLHVTLLCRVLTPLPLLFHSKKKLTNINGCLREIRNKEVLPVMNREKKSSKYVVNFVMGLTFSSPHPLTPQNVGKCVRERRMRDERYVNGPDCGGTQQPG